MARKRKMEAGAINIRVHPHPSEEQYINLLKDIFRLKRSVDARGDQMLLLSFLDRPRINESRQQMKGTIARFTNIEPDQSWFNLETNDAAEDDEVSQISIPDNLKPNYKPFSFIFFPEKHKLVFEKYSDNSSISHGIIASFFKKLCDDPSIVEKYGQVNIDVIGDKSSLESIFKIPFLRHLDITIERPNPDDHEAEEREVLERMNAQSVNKIKQNLTAIHGYSIKPDRQTRVLANVAVENGIVYGDGADLQGKKVDISTSKYPRTERLYYDPDVFSAADAFNAIAERFV